MFLSLLDEPLSFLAVLIYPHDDEMLAILLEGIDCLFKFGNVSQDENRVFLELVQANIEADYSWVEGQESKAFIFFE